MLMPALVRLVSVATLASAMGGCLPHPVDRCRSALPPNDETFIYGTGVEEGRIAGERAKQSAILDAATAARVSISSDIQQTKRESASGVDTAVAADQTIYSVSMATFAGGCEIAKRCDPDYVANQAALVVRCRRRPERPPFTGDPTSRSIVTSASGPGHLVVHMPRASSPAPGAEEIGHLLEGGVVRFSVDIPRDGFLYVFAIDANNNVDVLKPSRVDRNPRVQRGIYSFPRPASRDGVVRACSVDAASRYEQLYLLLTAEPLTDWGLLPGGPTGAPVIDPLRGFSSGPGGTREQFDDFMQSAGPITIANAWYRYQVEPSPQKRACCDPVAAPPWCEWP